MWQQIGRGCAHRAALATQLPVTQQAFTLLNARVFLPVVQILQLVNVVLAFRLSFLHVDVREHTLDDGDLNTQAIKSIYSHTLREPF